MLPLKTPLAWLWACDLAVALRNSRGSLAICLSLSIPKPTASSHYEIPALDSFLGTAALRAAVSQVAVRELGTETEPALLGYTLALAKSRLRIKIWTNTSKQGSALLNVSMNVHHIILCCRQIDR